jgi:hypothetical protein
MGAGSAAAEAAAAAAAAEGREAPAEGTIVTRPVYARRILDVVKQIRKQKTEIARIVGDVRTLQAQLAAISETVRRNAAAATEQMEAAARAHARDAKEYPAYLKALRQLLALQEAFSNLLQTVTAAGAADNEARDFENRAEQLAQRNDAERTAQIVRDTASIREENAQLRAALS